MKKHELSRIAQRTELSGSRVGGSRKKIEIEKKNVNYIITNSNKSPTKAVNFPL